MSSDHLFGSDPACDVPPSEAPYTLIPGYHSARESITQPGHYVACHRYFVEHWRLLLEPLGFALVLYLRSLCYYNPVTGETRNIVTELSRDDMAKACGVSRRTLIRYFTDNPWIHYFVSTNHTYEETDHGLNAQVENSYVIMMTDPLIPDHYALLEAKLDDLNEPRPAAPQGPQPGRRTLQPRPPRGRSEHPDPLCQNDMGGTPCQNGIGSPPVSNWHPPLCQNGTPKDRDTRRIQTYQIQMRDSSSSSKPTHTETAQQRDQEEEEPAHAFSNAGNEARNEAREQTETEEETEARTTEQQTAEQPTSDQMEPDATATPAPSGQTGPAGVSSLPGFWAEDAERIVSYGPEMVATVQTLREHGVYVRDVIALVQQHRERLPEVVARQMRIQSVRAMKSNPAAVLLAACRDDPPPTPAEAAALARHEQNAKKRVQSGPESPSERYTGHCRGRRQPTPGCLDRRHGRGGPGGAGCSGSAKSGSYSARTRYPRAGSWFCGASDAKYPDHSAPWGTKGTTFSLVVRLKTYDFAAFCHIGTS